MGMFVTYESPDGDKFENAYLKVTQVTFVNDKTAKLPNVEYGIWKSKTDRENGKPAITFGGIGYPDYQFKDNKTILKDAYDYLKEKLFKDAKDDL